MGTTTMGVKLDEATRDRIKLAAQQIDRTPHWLIKQAIFNYLEQLEQGAQPAEFPLQAAANEAEDPLQEEPHQPFLDFAEQILPQTVARAAITSAWRRPEPEAVSMMLEQARLPAPLAEKAQQLAWTLADKLRHQKGATGRAGMVQSLLQEFSLSSQEGVALMCLAEALLRIPDKPTRDALIRDKISNGNWQAHLGRSPSLFVNAATWGLLFTGRLVSTHNEANLSRSLNRIIGKSGEPLIRKGVDMAMRLMGEQFVTGETIAEALANARKLEEKGFRYSYDMLGEAALTANDAKAYLLSYQQAIHAIGKASNGRGIYEGPGISIKLSALHPRYSRAQYTRVMDELYPILKSLTLLARSYDIGINIDAEEADRLELSLDLLEKLCFEPELEGWNGIGFVIQAYQKRCPFVIDSLIDLAQRSRRRLMIRLVKGAYWDSEIKRAQVEGLEGYPVYTRKVYTDISYLACARKLLAVPSLIYPQFATHNAHSLAAIYQLAGNNYYPGQYEFQCLHGMGEPLYEQVVGKTADGKLNRPCRIYAPVGTHETLLAYLVRRLLENGANTSFVNRIADKTLPLDELVADPVQQVERLAATEGAIGLPHPKIPLPRDLYGDKRPNSAGLDLANEHRLASLSSALLSSATQLWRAEPMIEGELSQGDYTPLLNPADPSDIVGEVREASEQEVAQALQASVNTGPIWFVTPPQERAVVLERAAELMEGQMQTLIG
ncbi:MAG: bifunctional proline dehydrogenase/L-glutamate gamma-semialdehyde dehydrogenase PutA, partial [Pantoea sp.]|nr:bifunctional proline dehydrogenase/L-glutamate gamma-semialdehyde dehydrogenase PutA [Pantoea sp.]